MRWKRNFLFPVKITMENILPFTNYLVAIFLPSLTLLHIFLQHQKEIEIAKDEKVFIDLE